MAKRALSKFQTQPLKEVEQFLQNPPGTVPERTIAHMRASALRESKMMDLVQQVVGLMDDAYGRMLSNQEG
jgi:hypothetical protein